MKNPFSSLNLNGESTQESSQWSPCSSSSDFDACLPQTPLRSPGEYAPDDVRMEKEFAVLCLNEAEEKHLAALTEFTNKTGMPVTQENGQRRYGPPLNCTITVLPRGSEVFVGKLPRDCYEPEIIPIFEQMGQIYELRLMMDFSGTNRGYCFVHYFCPADADRAVKELNNYEIRKGRNIGVVKSVDNCRLFIGGIPFDKDETEIRTELNKLVVGVVKVITHPCPRTAQNNRGFAFVEFENHKGAATARRKLMPGNLKMWGTDIAVDWAEPEEEIEVLFVRNIKPTTSEFVIKRAFDAASENGVLTVNKVKDYAFVHFMSHTHAEMAKMAMECASIEGSEIQVQWSRSNLHSKREKKWGNKVRIEFDTSKSCITPSPWMNPRNCNQSEGNYRYGNMLSNVIPIPDYGLNYYGWQHWQQQNAQFPPPSFVNGCATVTKAQTACQYSDVTYPMLPNYSNNGQCRLPFQSTYNSSNMIMYPVPANQQADPVNVESRKFFQNHFYGNRFASTWQYLASATSN